MGNTCSPDNKKKETQDPAPDTENLDVKAVAEEAENAEGVDDVEATKAEAKISQLVNFHVAENERLKKENSELKSQGTARAQQTNEQTEENERLMKELSTMRALLTERNTAVLEAKLEAALHSRANIMLYQENSAKLLIKGTLEKFGKGGKGNLKKKFVEVNLHKAEHTQNGFVPGLLRLNYADGAEASTKSTGRVLKVQEATNIPAKYKGLCFSVVTMIEDKEKNLVFACPDVDTRENWVKMFKKGFADIEQEVLDMHKIFSLKIEFSKPKLGIRVEEKILNKTAGATPAAPQEKKEDVEPAPTAPAAAAAAPPAEEGKEEIPAPADAAKEAAAAPADAEDAAAAAEPAAEKEPEKEDAAAPPAAAEPAAETKPAPEPAEEEQKKDPPCTLIVTAISDDDIRKQGLAEQMSLVALNDKKLDGLGYHAQLDLVRDTPKPFILTFSGPKYLQKAAVTTNAYPEILKQLLSDKSNPTQKAFSSIITGSTFQKDLQASEDPKQLIRDLLNNQRQLSALLQNLQVNTADL